MLHIRPAEHGRDGRIGLHRVLGDPEGGLLEELRDHGREHLHVAHLLRPDAEQQVTVLARDVGIPRLEAVLQGHGDLTVLATQDLLQLARIDGVRLVRGRLVLKLLLVKEHGSHSRRRNAGSDMNRIASILDAMCTAAPLSESQLQGAVS
ncbi:hypothetical protein MN0502_33740 (plasmid) [Arthrobacter sp. MN05-02]|nr:hypothetical protein MN0502_33740 [Arthrobacter sp. MN05-02]